MLDSNKTVLVVIDIQGKLSQMVYEKESLFDNFHKLIEGVQVLGIPIILTEQNPDRLGKTLPEIATLLPGIQAVPKFSFSCCDVAGFMEELKKLNRKQVLICGIETHVCVYQTAMDLLGSGYEVQVVADAVSSRTLSNKTIALERMRDEGIKLTSTEMVLFELLEIAQGPKFKELLKIVK